MSSEQRRSEFCSSAGNISVATKVIKTSGRSVFSSRLAVVLTRQERHWGQLLSNILMINFYTAKTSEDGDYWWWRRWEHCLLFMVWIFMIVTVTFL